MASAFKIKYSIFCLAFTALIIISCQPEGEIVSQPYLHVDGKTIVDGNGDNFIIRGLGPGGWMLQEGYMFHTKVGTQFEIRNMLEELTDTATTEAFYEEWLKTFFTREDVKLASEWGFNSIRIPIHYKLFTPSIEDEPIKGRITWIDKGFVMLDSLLAWCSDYEIYLIIDLHAAPGGQGKNASISDYDETKPSLWESEDNQAKMVALWRQLANRYKDEPYIGGYDILNETNWAFENDGTHPNGCDCTVNAPLLSLFQRTIGAIREVDIHHIIYVEGNCWANNFQGMHSLATYDDNIAFSFHKYWNFNDDNELKYILDLRDSLNVPLYLGETGENSNTWFTDMVTLVEKHNIGWSQWAYKQMDNDDPFTIVCPSWKAISDYNPKTGENRPGEAEARIAMADMLQSIQTKNCKFNEDVVRAYLVNPFVLESKAYTVHNIPGIIFATDYDMGPLDLAWSDKDYHTVHSANLKGNRGGVYRNDGVDISPCSDKISNGYQVYLTETGEWMNYSLASVDYGNYDVTIRVAGKSGKLNLKLDDQYLSEKTVSIKATSGKDVWTDIVLKNVSVGKGSKVLTLMIEEGGFDINYVKFEPSETSVL